MGSEHFGLIELFLFFGLAVGFGAWQLWSLRRDRKAKRDDDPKPSP